MDLIPHEIFDLVVQYLRGTIRKSLQLTSRKIHERVPFHIERVFLSPNYKNIEVCRAILADGHWRQQVREIIWDDAKFSPPPEGTFSCGCEEIDVECTDIKTPDKHEVFVRILNGRVCSLRSWICMASQFDPDDT